MMTMALMAHRRVNHTMPTVAIIHNHMQRGLLAPSMRLAKAADPIDVAFGWWTRMCPRSRM